METRTLLQIVLGVIITLIVLMGGFIVYDLTKEPETIVIKQIVEPEVVERINPWADKGDAAISLVKRLEVSGPLMPIEKKEEDEPKRGKKGAKAAEVEPEETVVISFEEALQNPEFVKNVLGISGEIKGWESQWWEETRFGPHFFLVRFAFKDGEITTGPEWIVDLKNQKVAPKNLPAQVLTNPTLGTQSEYYGKNQQIVSAIANHRFESRMPLSGALLLYFEQRADGKSEDNIIGWTIHHERGNLFKAYFQWLENNVGTYAEFEFDFDRKALKPINLQAANLMNVGEDFNKQRVSIMPMTYNPSAPNRANRWIEGARKQCRQPQHKPGCDALATIFDEREVVEALEWLLTAQANTADDFEVCKRNRECRWMPSPKDEPGKYNVKYAYNLKGKEQNVSWDIDLKTGTISPADRISQTALSVIRAR